MRIYEQLFIVRPDATEEEVDPLIDQLRNVINHAGGTVEKSEKWGTRRLAYRVVKYDEGQYILLQFTAQPDTVKELERRLRVSDLVLKYLTVRIDETHREAQEGSREACGAQAAGSDPGARNGRPAVSGRGARACSGSARRAGNSGITSGREGVEEIHHGRTKRWTSDRGIAAADWRR